MVERSAVNRLVVGSNPTSGAMRTSRMGLFDNWRTRFCICVLGLGRDTQDAGWSSLVARQAHNLKAAGSNPAPATKKRDEFVPRLCAQEPQREVLYRHQR